MASRKNHPLVGINGCDQPTPQLPRTALPVTPVMDYDIDSRYLALTSYDICEGLRQDNTDPQHALLHLLFAGCPIVLHEIAQRLVQLPCRFSGVLQIYSCGGCATFLLGGRVGVASSGEELRTLFGGAVRALVS